MKEVSSAALNDKLLVVTYWMHCDGIINCLNDVEWLSEDTKRRLVAKVARAIVDQGTAPESITRIKRFVMTDKKCAGVREDGKERDHSHYRSRDREDTV